MGDLLKEFHRFRAEREEGLGLFGSRGFEFAEIVSGTEDRTGRTDQENFDGGISAQREESCPQSFQHLPGKSIPLFRMIESDFADAILGFKSQDSLIHYVTDSMALDESLRRKTPKEG